MVLNILASACPLILCAIGALFSEFAGVLALFLDGIISLSAFTVFHVAFVTGNAAFGFVGACVFCVVLVFILGLLTELCKGEMFIAAISMNLLFSALVSFFSYISFGTRGVLTSSVFVFDVKTVQISTIVATIVLVVFAIWFFRYTKIGLYIRITGSDSDVLRAKGVNPMYCRLCAWCFAALYGSVAGSILVMRLSSFVPNISSGRGWMALAAVFLGNKKPKRIILALIIFCIADFVSSNIQTFIPAMPSSVILSLPYITVLVLISVKKED